MSDHETRDSQLIELLRLHRNELSIYHASQVLFLEAILANSRWEENLKGEAQKDTERFKTALKEVIKNLRKLSSQACKMTSSVSLS